MDRILVVFVFFAVFASLWAAIFKKAGYSLAMGLLMLIPVVNLFTFIYFACAEWPIHRKLAEPANVDEWGTPQGDRIDTMLRQAASFEQRGDWNEAANLFEVLADELKGQPGSEFAAHSAKRIRERHLPAQGPAG